MPATSSSLLINESPLQVLPSLAQRIGLNEAIILQQIQYWLKINERKGQNFREGRWWTYNSAEEWQRQFPFWSVATIRRALANLRKPQYGPKQKPLVIAKQLSDNNYDHTLWYTIDYDVLDDMRPNDSPPPDDEMIERSDQNDQISLGKMDTSNTETTTENIEDFSLDGVPSSVAVATSGAQNTRAAVIQNAEPTTFQGWLGMIRESKNRQAVLLRLFKYLFPEHDPPSYAYIGKVAKKIGAARLAGELWQCAVQPPLGDILAYIQRKVENGGGDQQKNKAAQFDFDPVAKEVADRMIAEYAAQRRAGHVQHNGG